MASSSKKRTTMAKLAREHKLRERRMEKQARKDARRDAADDARLAGETDVVPASPDQEPVVSDAPPVTDEN
jgi:hypothetical protein